MALRLTLRFFFAMMLSIWKTFVARETSAKDNGPVGSSNPSEIRPSGGFLHALIVVNVPPGRKNRRYYE